MLSNRSSEGSPLLPGDEDARRKQLVWNEAGGTMEEERLRDLSKTRRKRLYHQEQEQQHDGDGGLSHSSYALRRRKWKWNWRVPAGTTGILLLSMALTGLGAIYSTTIRREAAVRGEAVTPETLAPVPLSAAREVDTRVGGGKTVGKEPEISAEPKADQSQSKLNVFFIMVDDLGWDDIGYRSTDLHAVTPNLDKLAAGGVKLTNYYSMSICTPARASLMTGRYVVRYGLQYELIHPAAPWGLPVSEKLLPEYMKDAGYETHMVGKWHLGSYTQDLIPSQRGFDTFMGYLNDEETYWSHQSWTAKLFGRKFTDFGFGNASGYYDITERPIPDHVQTSFPVDVDGDDHSTSSTMQSATTSISSSMSPTGDRVEAGGYSTRLFQDRAVEVLEQKTPFDDEPLFMYLSHQAVHAPLGLPPDGSFSAEEMAVLEEVEASSNPDEAHLRVRFAKVLMYLDQTIGELVDYLEAGGWMENSIIVVASDNGGCMDNGGSNYPLRGSKYSYWEGGNKVPAFVYSTSHIARERWGTEYDGMMHVTDWLPTIASAAGIGLHGSAGPLDGIDQWDFIVNSNGVAAEANSPRQEMLYNFDPYVLTTNDDDFVFGPDFALATGAFRSGKYKYISKEACSGWFTFNSRIQAEDPLTNGTVVCDGDPCSSCSSCTSHPYHEYLFDIEADPREENNLYAVYPEIATRLRERFTEVALSEWMDSLHKGEETRAYYVWMKYNWWMVPWWSLSEDATEDPFGINSTTTTTTSSSSSSSLPTAVSGP